MKAAVRAVLCDLDGTLVDTAADLAAATNGMLTECGLPERDPAQIATFIGKGIPMLVRRALSGTLEGDADETLFKRALPIFERRYAEESGRQAQIYPGVREGLTRMRAAGMRLGCITNKAGRFTLDLLEQTDLASYFDIVVSGDTLPRKKPDPLPVLHACEQLGVTPDEAILIGDSLNDVTAGRAAGVTVVVVPYGYNEGQSVDTLDAHAVVEDFVAAARLVGA